MKFTVRHLTHLGAAMALRQHIVMKIWFTIRHRKAFEDNDSKPISITDYMKKICYLTLQYHRDFRVQKHFSTHLLMELSFGSQVSTFLAPQLPFSTPDVRCPRYPSCLDGVQARAMIDFASRVRPSLQLSCSVSSVALATEPAQSRNSRCQSKSSQVRPP